MKNNKKYEKKDQRSLSGRNSRVWKIGILFAAIFLLCTAGAEAEAASQAADVKDGSYEVSVDMEGGSGRASISSPCQVEVRDGSSYATIVWSSSHYDYMIVDGEKYLPINTEGNSTFEIPVLVYDEAMEVIADTTAMSTPHEIEYSLTFHSEDLKSGMGWEIYPVLILGILVIAAAIYTILRKRG